MNEKENQFRDLKRALKLKRHEIPPPGYFNNFSGNVISRIRAGEASESHSPWLARFLHLFDSRPGMIGAFATCLVMLLALGLIAAQRGENSANGSGDLSTISGQTAMTSVNPLIAAAATPQLAADATGGIAVSTNPVVSLQPVATLFGEQNPLFQSASFGR